MQEYLKLRNTMVSNQLAPANVLSSVVLKAFAETPREAFLPEAHKSIAYSDAFIYIDDKNYLMPPFVVGRMIQGLGVNSSHTVLEINCGTGYASAVLGKITQKVIAIDQNAELINYAQRVVQGVVQGARSSLRANNISFLHVPDIAQITEEWPKLQQLVTPQSASQDGSNQTKENQEKENQEITNEWRSNESEEEGLFDRILINGAVELIPQPIIDLLRNGGSLVTILLEKRSQIVVLNKNNQDITIRSLYDAYAPPLKGFLRPQKFTIF